MKLVTRNSELETSELPTSLDANFQFLIPVTGGNL